MYFTTKIIPKNYKETHRYTLVDNITRGLAYTLSKHIDGHTNIDKNETFVRVFKLQKFRKKTRQFKKKGNAQYPNKTQSTIIRNGYWTAQVYDIPLVLLKLMNKKVIQTPRTFKLININ